MSSYKHKASTNASGEQSWHNLTKSTSKAVVSPSFKLRRIRKVLKIGCIIFLIAVISGTIIFLVKYSAYTTQRSIASQTLPIERIEFKEIFYKSPF